MEKRLLDQLLEDGAAWCLSLKDQIVWAQAYSHQPSGIEFVIPKIGKHGADIQLRPGEFIRTQLPHETGVYYLKLQLDEVQVEEKQIIATAYVAADLEHVQRRDAFRVRLLLDSKLREHEGQVEQEALIRDLSETGARISVAGQPELPPVKGQIICAFNTADLGDMVLKSQIRWKSELENRCEIGVRFLSPSKEDAERLRKYIWETQLKRIQG